MTALATKLSVVTDNTSSFDSILEDYRRDEQIQKMFLEQNVSKRRMRKILKATTSDSIESIFPNALQPSPKNLMLLRDRFLLTAQTLLNAFVRSEDAKKYLFIVNKESHEMETMMFMPSYEDEIVDVEVQKVLNEYILRLAPVEKEVVFLYFYENLSYEKIAKFLGCEDPECICAQALENLKREIKTRTRVK